MRPENVTEEELAKNIQPVIMGADFLAYAYIRDYMEAYGVKPIILASADIKAISSSRFCDYRVIEGIDTPEVFLSEVTSLGKQLCEEGKIPQLLGCGDFYARLISQNKPELEKYYYTSYIDFDLLDNITQKENFYNICEEIGIPYPKTIFLDCSNQDGVVDDGGFTYPLIAKASNSAAYHYAKFPNKKKIFIVESRDELEEIYDNLKKSSYDKSLIVQEFIPGDDTQLRSITIGVDSDMNPMFMVSGRVMLEDHSPTAIGNPAIIISENRKEILDNALKFMRHVGYHGIANFDAKYDARTGEYVFFEVNTRPGRSSDYINLAGCNFAKAQAEECILHKRFAKPIPCDKPFVYSVVPPYVVKRSLEDSPEKQYILQAFKSGLAHFPLEWKKDCLQQKFWAWVNYYHQIDKYRKYLWEAGGKQADVD